MSALVFSRDRMGEEVDQVVIKEIISSFVVLLKFKARNQMQVCPFQKLYTLCAFYEVLKGSV